MGGKRDRGSNEKSGGADAEENALSGSARHRREGGSGGSSSSESSSSGSANSAGFRNGTVTATAARVEESKKETCGEL